MGAGKSKDQFIDLYLNTNKQYYFPGQFVEGEAYLNVKDTKNYSTLCLRLQGIQNVRWTQSHKRKTRTFINTYKSYSDHHVFVDFHGTVNAGMYLFPFSFLLPNMLTGSFLQSQNNYIKYLLKLELTHPTDQDKSQQFFLQLNIIEPPRSILGPITVTRSTNSKCCGCCSDYGITSVTLNCNKNFVYNGDSIQVTGVLNNSQGKQNIQQWGVNFLQKRVMISANGMVRHVVEQKVVLLNNPGVVAAGTSRQINFNAIIPANIVNYTAIGRITARYFKLHLWTEYGCCTKDNVCADLHLILHSKTPMVVQKRNIPPPANWSPKVYPKVSWTTLKPYNYKPLPQIPFLNMPTTQNMPKNQPIMETTENFANDELGYQMAGYMLPSNDFVPPKVQYNNVFNPVFYEANMLSQVERQFQGYGAPMGQPMQGQPPNFNNGMNQM